MIYKRNPYLDKIFKHLTILASIVKSKNQLSLNDDSKSSESFFKDLLNIIFGYNFINLNNKEKNYAGIDLGDASERICVQITSSNTSKKIQETLDISDKHKRYEEYDEITILIIGYKQKYKKIFTSKFKKCNVWDIRDVFQKIDSLPTPHIEKIIEYLDRELDTVIKINPIDLLDKDISIIIDILFNYLSEKGFKGKVGSQQQYKLVRRQDGFIDKKNNLNNVNELLFNSEIRPSLKYDKKIEDFLKNPINVNFKKKYFAITEIFQKIYSNNTDEFNGMASLFGFIFDEVITYENRENLDDSKLLILLHNMYFNCDLGNNPK
ncbi:MAG: hypothetical protein UR31_C0011G0030 [Parcubacteria group bacterium GW2011_GWA2_33_14]|uniref:SMEK domain-containing protein n=1 Tax=Candidatus Staskawiczbacteria bacterium RIFCSPHIGHO2_02_FULL_33_16 TaxID=1802204 RepID=A0A1G2HTH3_9BACT|nr:MAG: hypothetical protein UR31_C0011G0030 [Parcubacteria group bacterium GW2011_GWA2_33_14]OGZ65834.1 MAG: hypothetical protein A3D34_03230 [Candidatus Staskawiczbacteria bacterium RIFCSPHIGHO2_02_FULL_33_16]OGZ70490.1 MAG: hypothetical protein A2980_00875 [Candidatus Staskawiczbacteria bacterium RIFCSPLOWO2_01_FULL_33_13]